MMNETQLSCQDPDNYSLSLSRQHIFVTQKSRRGLVVHSSPAQDLWHKMYKCSLMNDLRGFLTVWRKSLKELKRSIYIQCFTFALLIIKLWLAFETVLTFCPINWYKYPEVLTWQGQPQLHTTFKTALEYIFDSGICL